MSEEPIKAFFIGCVQSSEVCLKALLARPEIIVTGVFTLRSSGFNADFVDISDVARKAGVPVYFAEEIDTRMLVEILRGKGLDVIFAVGWSHLLGRDILESARYGVVGFHPAALPQNRGRHPLIWALALGLKKTASTFFLMDDGADSGPIISQVSLEISRFDDARSLYDKVLTLLPDQVNSIVDRLVIGNLGAVPQDHERATTWRKREAPDGLIDWRMSSEAIYNLTRALARPYIGAEVQIGDSSVKVWRCEILTKGFTHHAEPGKVLEVDGRGAVIKTGLGAAGGAVRLLEAENLPELRRGDYL